MVRLIPLADIRDRFSLGHTVVYDWIKEGLFPPPIKIGASARWPSNEVDSILRARVAGSSDSEIQKLVRDLIARRAGTLDTEAA